MPPTPSQNKQTSKEESSPLKMGAKKVKVDVEIKMIPGFGISRPYTMHHAQILRRHLQLLFHPLARFIIRDSEDVSLAIFLSLALALRGAGTRRMLLR